MERKECECRCDAQSDEETDKRDRDTLKGGREQKHESEAERVVSWGLCARTENGDGVDVKVCCQLLDCRR